MRTGTSVTARPQRPPWSRFCQRQRPNSRPSWACRVRQVYKRQVMISRRRRVGPTPQRFGDESSARRPAACPRMSVQPAQSSCGVLDHHDGASTMAPMAIATPPRDIDIGAQRPGSASARMGPDPMGSETITTEQAQVATKQPHTSATTMNSSTSFSVRLATARSMSCESIVGAHHLDPWRQTFLKSASLSLTQRWFRVHSFPER